MRIAAHGRVGIAVACALGGVACGGSASLVPQTPSAVETGGSGASKPLAGLLGNWQLVSLTEAGHRPVTLAEPELFTVEFKSDGRVALRADCNRC